MGLKTSVCSPKRLCGGINIFLISEEALSELSLSTFRTAAVWPGLIQGLFCIWSGAFTKPKTSSSVSLGKTLRSVIVVFFCPHFYGTVIDTTAICKWKVWTKSERTIFLLFFLLYVLISCSSYGTAKADTPWEEMQKAAFLCSDAAFCHRGVRVKR